MYSKIKNKYTYTYSNAFFRGFPKFRVPIMLSQLATSYKLPSSPVFWKAKAPSSSYQNPNPESSRRSRLRAPVFEGRAVSTSRVYHFPGPRIRDPADDPPVLHTVRAFRISLVFGPVGFGKMHKLKSSKMLGPRIG